MRASGGLSGTNIACCVRARHGISGPRRAVLWSIEAEGNLLRHVVPQIKAMARRYRGFVIDDRERVALRLAVYRNDARGLLAAEAILDPDCVASFDVAVG